MERLERVSKICSSSIKQSENKHLGDESSYQCIRDQCVCGCVNVIDFAVLAVCWRSLAVSLIFTHCYSVETLTLLVLINIPASLSVCQRKYKYNIYYTILFTSLEFVRFKKKCFENLILNAISDILF